MEDIIQGFGDGIALSSISPHYQILRDTFKVLYCCEGRPLLHILTYPLRSSEKTLLCVPQLTLEGWLQEAGPFLW